MVDTVAGSPQQVKVRSFGLSRDDSLIGLLLLIVVVVGGYFRFIGQNWDEYTLWHPDERFLTQVVASLGGPLAFTDSDIAGKTALCLERYPETGGRGGFFDAACSPLNPNNTGNGLYVYGTLPAFLVRGTADTLAQLTGDTNWSSYYGGRQVGRLLSAVAEIGVILTTFLIGLRLHGKWVGLLAAVLYCCTVFSIQQAHFWTADAISNFMVALAILGAVRIQTGGKLGSYLFCGLFCGAALASRINTAPVIGLLLLAVGVRLLPVLTGRLAWNVRGQLLANALMGVTMALLLAFLAFRVLNPYAFSGPGFLGLSLNPGWLQDAGEAQHLVSGNAESPPNWQWASRTAYLFPLSNMVLWGMGIALGLTAWGAWAVSGWQLIRGRQNALRNLLLFVWVLVYFAWLGRLWVMTMRYYLPMYPVLAVLAAWALVALVRWANKSPRVGLRLASRSLLLVVVGFTAVWAMMFTNIYRSMFAPAQSTHWVADNLPGDFSMQIDGENAPLINISMYHPQLGRDVPLDQQAARYEEGQVYSQVFTAPADGDITKIHAPHLGDPNDDSGTETLRIRISVPDGNLVLAEGVLTADLKRDEHVLGSAYDIPLSEPVTLQAGETYNFTIEIVSGGPIISSGPVFAWEGQWDEVSLPKVCALPEGEFYHDDLPPSGVSVQNCRARDLWGNQLQSRPLEIYYEDDAYKRDLMQRGLDDSDYLIISTNRRYDSQSRIPYRWPMTMQFYSALFNGQLGFELVKTFHESFELGPLKVSDQYLPIYSGAEWLNEFEAEEAFHVYDHPAVFIFKKTSEYSTEKTAAILERVPLNKVDAVTTHGNCAALPMTATASFYCDPQLIGVVMLYSVPASKIPTALQFPTDLAGVQREGGTWSERFHSESIINTQPVVTVLSWWVVILVFGWVVWPLLFVVFPQLADRGYAFAKIAGLLFIGWLAWFVSSARIPMWSQQGIVIVMVIMAAVSGAVVWRKRSDFSAYLRANLRNLVWIEAISLGAFIFFLLIRLTNPDLWHPYFGGEKPMDFAYFNGVLRSTVFPPVDPWHAGGYINYYYFGYVIVGSPVLLLGMIPSIAYNLIIPTLFALTGMGAFSVAYNVVSAWQERTLASGKMLASDEFQVSPQSAVGWNTRMRKGNPWLAGIAAFLLAVVLGNLHTPSVFVNEGLLKAGNYQQTGTIQQELIADYRNNHNGADPTGDDLTAIVTQAAATANSPFAALLRGIGRVFSGAGLDIAPNRWYWAATRVLSETPDGGGNAIAEFPFFTFLYGDLHAHMISMPLMLLVMGFVLHEVLISGNDKRGRWSLLTVLALGGITAGMLRATNTWDWITFMLLGVLGLGFAWWLNTSRISRWTLWSLVVRIGVFVGISFLAALPFTTWYASVYSQAKLWEGARSQIWMYVTVHGLFLFLLLSLLIWETGRWLRSVYVRSLRGQLPIIIVGLCIVFSLLFLGVFLSLFGVPFALTSSGLSLAPIPVAIVAMPILVWISVLFLRQGQSREMRYILALAGLAVGLTLGVEMVVLDGDIGRQNTVFKFYVQAWLLFSVVGGTAVAWLVQSSTNWSRFARWTWYPLGTALLLAAALYPIMATRGRSLDRLSPQAPQTLNDVPLTLDGLAYMQYSWLYEGDPVLIQADPSLAPFSLADDYQIVRWLQENVQGTPTIMEGMSDREYRWQSRVAITTGLPAVNGWNFHQRQQRTFDPLPRLVEQRVANVNAFYTTLSITEARDILRHYDVRYVIVSSLERAYYPVEGLVKFDQMVEQGFLELVYEHGNGKIYQVKPDLQFALEEDVAGGV